MDCRNSHNAGKTNKNLNIPKTSTTWAGPLSYNDIEDITGEEASSFYCNFLELISDYAIEFTSTNGSILSSGQRYICTLKREQNNHCDGDNCILQRILNRRK